MRASRWVHAIAAGLIACGADESPDRIARQVDLGSAGSVQLGASLSDALGASRVADTLYEIRPESSTARLVRVSVGSDRRVTAVETIYWPGTRYDTLVQHYLLQLGDPQGRVASDIGVETTWWDDGRTHFEVRGRASGLDARVSTRLVDATDGRH